MGRRVQQAVLCGKTVKGDPHIMGLGVWLVIHYKGIGCLVEFGVIVITLVVDLQQPFYGDTIVNDGKENLLAVTAWMVPSTGRPNQK